VNSAFSAVNLKCDKVKIIIMAKIPRFRTEEEIREFWDTHDSAAYFEDMEDDVVYVTFVLRNYD